MSCYLNRYGIDASISQKAELAGIKDIWSFLSYSKWELVELLDVNLPQVETALSVASETICKSAKLTTCWPFYKESFKSHGTIPTGLSLLDEALRGGLSPGSLTEIIGPVATGKTQFCHMLCFSALNQSENGCVIYIDTEASFSATRLLEIFGSHSSGLSSNDMSKIIERVKVVRTKDMDELKILAKSLDKLVAESSASLVILDSIAFLTRESVSHSKFYYSTIFEVAEKLNVISKYYHVPILVTNRTNQLGSHGIFTDSGLLGYLWSYCCNIKLGIHPINVAGGTHEMKVLKSPFSMEHRFHYRIHNGGLVLIH